MSRTTTNLNIIRRAPRHFTWGEVVAVHDIGPYSLVEFHPHVFEDGRGTDKVDYDATEFHGYVNGESISQSFGSLDAAMAGVIAYRNDGPNSRAGTYFIKMIGGE